MKKVLVIAYGFPPLALSGVEQTAKTVKYLPKYGWHPIVLTASPEAASAFDHSLLEELLPLNIEVVRTDAKEKNRLLSLATKNQTGKLPSERLRRIRSMFYQSVLIPDNQILWKKKALEKASQIIERHRDIQVIYSVSPPFTSHIVAAELRKAYNLPVVLGVQTPWVENPSHFYLTPFHKRLHKSLEDQSIRAADKIITPNRLLKELLLRNYFGRLTHRDISIIPYGFDPQDFKLKDSEKRTDKKLRFVYSGVFRDDRSPKMFFLGLRIALQKDSSLANQIEARFVGVLPRDYLKLAEVLGLRAVIEIRGYKAHKEAIQECMNADVLWATLGNVRHNDTVSLHALYEYIACGKTIFGLVPEGASKRMILDANGLVARPDSPDEIASQILELANLWRMGKLPKPSPEFVEAYNQDRLTNQLAKEFEECVTLD
ncbi:MAG: glycosyltransferase family 4 protein [Chlorobiales bacterium]|nr:glycosyltransferase family 4 protein [Chlorobiales bacterium]